MVKIRLSRGGKRNDPFYRVVAINSQNKTGGKTLAVLGWWHPKNDTKQVDKEAIIAWTKKGAQVSPAVTKLIN